MQFFLTARDTMHQQQWHAGIEMAAPTTCRSPTVFRRSRRTATFPMPISDAALTAPSPRKMDQRGEHGRRGAAQAPIPELLRSAARPAGSILKSRPHPDCG